MAFTKSLVVCATMLLAMVILVQGHAKLEIPLAWQANPDTTAPCGAGGTPATTARATWVAGQTATIKWTVIAGDGQGPVEVILDSTGGNFDGTGNYTVIARDLQANAVEPFLFTINVPYDANCNSSKNGLCTIRVHGQTTSWTACSTVAIEPPCDGCPVPPPPPPVCTKATGLTFCKQFNNRNVMVAAGVQPALVDSQAKATFLSYTNNTRVFSTGQTTSCKADYQTYLCALNLPPCAGSDGVANGQACKSMCQKATQSCGLTESHAGLYVCDDLPECTGNNAFTVAPAFLLVVVAAFFALF